MKLNRLTLKNFLLYESAEIDLANVVMIFGRNDQGKTSLRDAIEFCLLGTARGIARKNQAGMLCRSGEKDFEVCIETETGKFFRGQSNRAPAAGDAEMIRAIIDPMSILRMAQDQRQSFFTRNLLPSEKEPAKLSFQPDSREFSAALSVLATGDVEGAFKEAYETRRAIGRQIKDLDLPSETPESKITVEGKSVDLGAGDWLGRLDQRRCEQAVVADKIRTLSAVPAVDLAQEKGGLRGQIEAARSAIAAHEQGDSGHAAKAKEVNAEIELLTREIGAIDGEAKAVSLMAENLKKSAGGQCVLSTPKLPIACGSTAEIAGQRSGLERKLRDLVEKSKLKNSAIDKARRDRTALNLDRDTRAAASRQMRLEIAEADRRVTEIDRLLAGADTLDGLQTQLADLDAKCAALGTIVGAAQKYRELAVRLAEGTAKKEKLDALHDQAERLVEELGPDGPVRAAAAGKAGEVEFCPLAADWHMRDLKLRRDGSILKGGIPVEMLGETAQYRAAILIAELGARQIGFLIIDRWDIFLPDLQAAFFKHIHQMREAMQVILIGSMDNPPSPSKSDWCKKYWVEAGTIREVTA